MNYRKIAIGEMRRLKLPALAESFDMLHDIYMEKDDDGNPIKRGVEAERIRELIQVIEVMAAVLNGYTGADHAA